MKDYRTISEKPSVNIINTSLIEERLDSKFYTSYNLSLVNNLTESRMQIKPLLELCSKITQGPNPKFIDDQEGIPCLRTRNVYDEYITLEGANYVSKFEYEKFKRFKINFGDILIAILGEGSIGKSNIYTLDREVMFNRPIGLVRIEQSKADPFYVSAYLRSFYGKKFIERGISGSSGQLVLGIEYLKTVPIPLPKYKVQSYIGNKIRKAEKLREEAKELQKEAESQLKILLEIEEDKSLYNNNAGNESTEFIKRPVYLYVDSNEINERLDAQSFHPEYFDTIKQVKEMKFLCTKLKDTLSYYDTGISAPAYYDKGLPIIMTRNINNSFIDLDTNFVFEKDIREDKFLNKNDVLITTYGGPSIGKVDIWDLEQTGTFDYTIMRLGFNQEFNPHFMLLLLRSKFVQNQIRYKIRGTTGITFINPKDILDVSIPKLPKEKQDFISEKLVRSSKCFYDSVKLIKDASLTIDSLIEGTFDESNIQ